MRGFISLQLSSIERCQHEFICFQHRRHRFAKEVNKSSSRSRHHDVDSEFGNPMLILELRGHHQLMAEARDGMNTQPADRMCFRLR